MPEIDGYVLTQLVKDHNALAHVPVVLHSSLSANPELDATVGADAYVAEFDLANLAESISDVLS